MLLGSVDTSTAVSAAFEVGDVLDILTLVVLESLLSVDNAAVMAIMVKDLPGKQKQRALRYGLLGAYLFRGLSLLLVSWLIQMLWLKILGGAYLCYLFIGHLTKRKDTLEEGIGPKRNRLFSWFDRKIGVFWSTVILVNLVDLAFSIDNVFAAVALSDKFWVVMTGVAIGILAIRLVAIQFVKLMGKYPQLEFSTYFIIFLLGLKLMASGIVHYVPAFSAARAVLDHHATDLIFSVSLLVILFGPLLFGRRKAQSP
jgi:YkoY family integral membrane protein